MRCEIASWCCVCVAPLGDIGMKISGGEFAVELGRRKWRLGEGIYVYYFADQQIHSFEKNITHG